MENEENQNQVSLRFPPPLEIAPRFPQSHNPDDDSPLPKTQNQKARKEPQRLKKPQPPSSGSSFDEKMLDRSLGARRILMGTDLTFLLLRRGLRSERIEVEDDVIPVREVGEVKPRHRILGGRCHGDEIAFPYIGHFEYLRNDGVTDSL